MPLLIGQLLVKHALELQLISGDGDLKAQRHGQTTSPPGHFVVHRRVSVSPLVQSTQLWQASAQVHEFPSSHALQESKQPTQVAVG